MLKIENANYRKVFIAIDRLRSRYAHACFCERCTSEIAATALNLLPPHYYVVTENSVRTGSPWVMVEAAVFEAIERVAASPGCEGREFRKDEVLP